MKVVCSYVVLLLVALQAEGKELTTEKILGPEKMKTNKSLLENFQNLDREFKNITNSGVKLILPILMDNLQKVNVSQECKKNILYLLSGIKRTKTWAIEFIDSSGKIPDGILTGSYSAFGAYDECLNIQVKKTRPKNDQELLFRGQYCMVNLKFESPPKPKANYMLIMPDELKNLSQGDTVISEFAKKVNFISEVTVKIGICMPSGCSTGDVNNMIHLLSNGKATASRCEIKERNEYTPFIIFVISVCCCLSFLVFVATLISVYSYYTPVTLKNPVLHALMTFSLFTNFKIFSSSSSKSRNLNCLNGVRFLGMTWIIYGHNSMFMTFPYIHGLKKIIDDVGQNFAFQVVINGTLSVDTFFLMGSLLASYLTIKMCKKQNYTFNAWMYIIHRILRILPTYCFFIILLFITPLLGSGPLWHEISKYVTQDCENSWWANILFINNIYPGERMCALTTWYVAADIQLYIFSLLIIIPLLRWPKIGFLLAALAIIICCAYSGIATYVRDLPPTVLFLHFNEWESRNYVGTYYGLPIVHLGPYAIGLILGYILATKPDLKMSLMTQIMGWSLAFTFCFSTLYGTVDWYKQVKPVYQTVVYASFSRTAWALGIAWMLLCCATGHGGIINYILSWRIFAPLGRLTFAAYLIHPLVITVFFGNIRTRLQPDFFLFVWFFAGNLCASYAVAFVIYMLVEIPSANLMRFFLFKPEKILEESSTMKENAIHEDEKKKEMTIL